MKIRANDVVCLLAGVREVAVDLGLLDSLGSVRKR
jgi:hypothetical protein